MAAEITRLQLGASRLENLSAEVLAVFLDKSWMHLGDDPKAVSWFRSIRRPHRPELYEKTNFRTWRYSAGDKLPFGDGTIQLIFSEHFFEHLFFDEAIALMNECARALCNDGLMRIVVPDADLRTYEPPEPVGYPSRRIPFTHPAKHKTRWNVYMLSEAVRLSGLEPRPIAYCDRDGAYIRDESADLALVQRKDSLIVDGIKH